VALESTLRYAARARGRAPSPYSRAHPVSSIFEGECLFQRASREGDLLSTPRLRATPSVGRSSQLKARAVAAQGPGEPNDPHLFHQMMEMQGTF
jgi:hypothetical protein